MSWKQMIAMAVSVAGGLLFAVQLQAQENPKEPPKGLFGDKDKKPPVGNPAQGQFPNIEELLKNLPAGLDPAVVEKIKKDLEKAQEDFKKKLEEFQKNPGGGAGFPGGFPGGGNPFPGGGNPFPGGGNPFGGGGNFGGFPGMPGAKLSPGRLGIEAIAPSEVLIEQLDLPAKKGLVIDKVVADSAAAKAGLKKNDILLEFAGKDVTNDPMQFRKIVAEMKTDEMVDAQVLRKGKKEMVKGIKLPEAKAEPKGGLFPPADKGGLFPPADKGGLFPPADKGGLFPPPDKGGFPMPPGGFPMPPGGFPGMPPGLFPQQQQAVPISIRDERLES